MVLALPYVSLVEWEQVREIRSTKRTIKTPRTPRKQEKQGKRIPLKAYQYARAHNIFQWNDKPIDEHVRL